MYATLPVPTRIGCKRLNCMVHLDQSCMMSYKVNHALVPICVCQTRLATTGVQNRSRQTYECIVRRALTTHSCQVTVALSLGYALFSVGCCSTSGRRFGRITTRCDAGHCRGTVSASQSVLGPTRAVRTSNVLRSTYPPPRARPLDRSN